MPLPPTAPLFPYTTLFRSVLLREQHPQKAQLAQLLDDLAGKVRLAVPVLGVGPQLVLGELARQVADLLLFLGHQLQVRERSEEHTSELQSPCNIVCRLLLE